MVKDVYQCVKESSKKGFKIARGINLLRRPYESFKLASEYGAKFVQLDTVLPPRFDRRTFEMNRTEYFSISVLGGVRFKYIPLSGKLLEEDLVEGKLRAEVIVTTGECTGIETPIEKFKDFKVLLGDYPFLVGAGINKSNIQEQLKICDGAIVGSALKFDNCTQNEMDLEKIESLVSLASSI